MDDREALMEVFGDMNITVRQASEETEFLKTAYEAEIVAEFGEDAMQRIRAGVKRRATARILDKLDELADEFRREGDDKSSADIINLKDHLK